MKRIVVGLMAGVLLLTACQSASEVLTEQLIEQVDGVDNVELDTDTGQVKIETDEGSISIGGGEIPAGFPVPVPNGGDVTAVITSPDGSSVTLTYPIDRYDELVMFYGDWTGGQPGEWNETTSTFSSGDQTIRSSNWFGSTANEDVNISVIDCFDVGGDAGNYDAACVTLITN